MVYYWIGIIWVNYVRHEILRLDESNIIHLTGDEGVKIEPLAHIEELGHVMWERRLGVGQSREQIVRRAMQIASRRNYSILNYDCIDFLTELLAAKPKLRLRHVVFGTVAIFGCSLLFKNKLS